MFPPPLSSPAQPQPATTIWQSQTDVSRPSSSPSSWPPAAAAAARELTQAEKVILIFFALFFSRGGVGRRRRELARQGRGDQKKGGRMDLLFRPYRETDLSVGTAPKEGVAYGWKEAPSYSYSFFASPFPLLRSYVVACCLPPFRCWHHSSSPPLSAAATDAFPSPLLPSLVLLLRQRFQGSGGKEKEERGEKEGQQISAQKL